MEQFDWREPLVKTEVFGQESDLPANLYVASRHAEDKSLTARRLGKTEKHFNRGAFPGAVGAEETKDFAAAHFQGKIAHGELISKNFAQMLGADRTLIGLGQESPPVLALGLSERVC